MEKSGLFNSENGDRKYSAKAIARLVSMIMANGVFNNPANNLEVEAIENSMKVKINSGRAVINGYWYENINEIGDELTLTLPSDSNRDVIYNIVLRLSDNDRLIRAYSVKGESNKSPLAPILTRNDDVYEICLANVLIKEGQTFIKQSDITDTRLDDRVCGITRRPFEKISTEEVFKQFQAWFNEQKDTYGVDLKKWQTEHKEEYSKFEEEQKKSFEDWFTKVVKILGENPNTNLLNEMDKLRKDMANLVEIYKKETYKNIEQLKEMIKTDPDIIDIQTPVKSVNGKKGEIVLKAKDINCEDEKSIEENLKENKSFIEEVNNKIKDIKIPDELKEIPNKISVIENNMGSVTDLKTDSKKVVEAINEVFQSANNSLTQLNEDKKNLKNAVVGRGINIKGDSIQDIINGIEQISGEAKGTIPQHKIQKYDFSTVYEDFEMKNLKFKPKLVKIFMQAQEHLFLKDDDNFNKKVSFYPISGVGSQTFLLSIYFRYDSFTININHSGRFNDDTEIPEIKWEAYSVGEGGK